MTELPTIAHAVATHARLMPTRRAAADSRRSLSWSEWHERSARLATSLCGLGLHQGDRVGIVAYNCLEWLEIYVGLARAGLIAVPINFRLSPTEMSYILEHAEVSAVIAGETFLESIEGIRLKLTSPICHCIALSIAAERRHALAHWLDYEDLIAQGSPLRQFEPVSEYDVCALMYTSGTTGRPKGAVRLHRGSSLIAGATAYEFSFTREDIALLVMPLCHANSLYFATTFIHLGASCVVDDRRSFDPEALLETLARERITFTSLVPTHYIMMFALPQAVKQRYALSHVSKLLISSAPARRETKLSIMEHFPNSRLFELYGSTEAGWVTLLRPEEQLSRLGSVGREWFGSGAIRLLDASRSEVADGEVGELFSRTPYVFAGYWKDDLKTAEAFEGDWCSVGDMARRDAEGYIWLVDRKSNMIISGGENIYPSEVEAVIAGHPSIKDVAVIGVADEKWGEVVLAVLVLRGEAIWDERALRAWCRERLAGFKCPRAFEVMGELDMPRTATGKIIHRSLRLQFETRQVA